VLNTYVLSYAQPILFQWAMGPYENNYATLKILTRARHFFAEKNSFDFISPSAKTINYYCPSAFAKF